jgi:hypothetical protein
MHDGDSCPSRAADCRPWPQHQAVLNQNQAPSLSAWLPLETQRVPQPGFYQLSATTLVPSVMSLAHLMCDLAEMCNLLHVT